MSELWFLIAIGCVFSSVLLVGFALDATATEKKRAVTLLESHVKGSSSLAESTDLREREMAQSFGERVLVPFVTGAGPTTDDPAQQLLVRTWNPALSVVGADGLPGIARAGNVLRPSSMTPRANRSRSACDGILSTWTQ